MIAVFDGNVPETRDLAAPCKTRCSMNFGMVRGLLVLERRDPVPVAFGIRIDEFLVPGASILFFLDSGNKRRAIRVRNSFRGRKGRTTVRGRQRSSDGSLHRLFITAGGRGNDTCVLILTARSELLTGFCVLPVNHLRSFQTKDP